MAPRAGAQLGGGKQLSFLPEAPRDPGYRRPRTGPGRTWPGRQGWQRCAARSSALPAAPARLAASRPRSLPGRSRVIRCRRLRQAPQGWRLLAAAGGAAGIGLPSPGRQRAGVRDASATRGPGGSERAPRPVVGGQSRAPQAGESGRGTLGLEKDAPSAPGRPQPPHLRLRLLCPHVVMAQPEVKEGGRDLDVPKDCSPMGVEPLTVRVTTLPRGVSWEIPSKSFEIPLSLTCWIWYQRVNNFCHSSPLSRPRRFSNTTE